MNAEQQGLSPLSTTGSTGREALIAALIGAYTAEVDAAIERQRSAYSSSPAAQIFYRREGAELERRLKDNIAGEYMLQVVGRLERAKGRP